MPAHVWEGLMTMQIMDPTFFALKFACYVPCIHVNFCWNVLDTWLQAELCFYALLLQKAPKSTGLCFHALLLQKATT